MVLPLTTLRGGACTHIADKETEAQSGPQPPKGHTRIFGVSGPLLGSLELLVSLVLEATLKLRVPPLWPEEGLVLPKDYLSYLAIPMLHSPGPQFLHL